MWIDYPISSSFALTLWSVNRMSWGFGLRSYHNPFIVPRPVVIYDYSQPLVVTGTVATTRVDERPEAPPPEVSRDFDHAVAAFQNRNYSTALRYIDAVIVKIPQDPVAHEFRALILYALGRYDEAAEAIHAVLAVGPGWDWKTMAGVYSDVAVYTQHLRNLEGYVREHPDSAPERFLLAYHYMTCGHEESAARQLKQVLRLAPGERVATDMLIMIEGPDAVRELEGTAPLPAPPPALVDPPDIEAAQVTGEWNATDEEEGTAFRLRLNEDGTFHWTAVREGFTRTVRGVWALEENVLALEPDSGGVMLAELSDVQAQGFTFRMAGAPEEEPGLKFTMKDQQ
jgi:tetratricopeptide (TPR) repeat protein